MDTPEPCEIPNVLIAEDESALRKVLTRYLRNKGFLVISCPDGRQAIQRLEETPVHALLTDIDMPHVGGLELLAWTREHRPETRLLVMTGLLSDELRQECFDLGVETCLQKPLRFDQVARLLRRDLRPSVCAGQNVE